MSKHLSRNTPRIPPRFERSPDDPFPASPWANDEPTPLVKIVVALLMAAFTFGATWLMLSLSGV